MGRQRRMEKKSKIKILGIEKFANIETLHKNKQILKFVGRHMYH